MSVTINQSKNYYPADIWSYEMTKDRHNELISVCEFLYAKEIKITYIKKDFIEASKTNGVNFFLPMAIPLPNGLVGGNSFLAGGAGLKENKREESNTRKESLLFVQRGDPTDNAYLPKVTDFVKIL